MQSHEQRVVDEKQALDEKLVALTKFISGNPSFEGMPQGGQVLLREQREVMIAYSDILGLRIASFSTQH